MVNLLYYFLLKSWYGGFNQYNKKNKNNKLIQDSFSVKAEIHNLNNMKPISMKNKSIDNIIYPSQNIQSHCLTSLTPTFLHENENDIHNFIITKVL
jgi:hypothetical protein